MLLQALSHNRDTNQYSSAWACLGAIGQVLSSQQVSAVPPQTDSIGNTGGHGSNDEEPSSFASDVLAALQQQQLLPTTDGAWVQADAAHTYVWDQAVYGDQGTPPAGSNAAGPGSAAATANGSNMSGATISKDAGSKGGASSAGASTSTSHSTSTSTARQHLPLEVIQMLLEAAATEGINLHLVGPATAAPTQQAQHARQPSQHDFRAGLQHLLLDVMGLPLLGDELSRLPADGSGQPLDSMTQGGHLACTYACEGTDTVVLAMDPTQ